MSLKRLFVFNEFTIVGVFVAVVFVGLVVGLVSAISAATPTEPVASVVTAPTLIEYRTEARAVLAPFLSQAETVDSEALTEEAQIALVDLASRTQERLLRIRVPASEREAHLSFVVVLDQWKNALAGTSDDLEGVLDRTALLVQKHRWVLPSDE